RRSKPGQLQQAAWPVRPHPAEKWRRSAPGLPRLSQGLWCRSGLVWSWPTATPGNGWVTDSAQPSPGWEWVQCAGAAGYHGGHGRRVMLLPEYSGNMRLTGFGLPRKKAPQRAPQALRTSIEFQEFPSRMPIIKSLCVYCGSARGNSPLFASAAQELGKSMAERQIRLIYGGARIGVMGEAADAVMRHGGQVIGIIPEHLQTSEVGHHGITELKVVDSMHSRKKLMFD